MHSSQHVLGVWMTGLLLACSISTVNAEASKDAPASTQHWVASWGAAQQQPEPHNELALQNWREGSLRQIVHTSLAGEQLRVRFSNAFGITPLMIDGASIAKAMAPGRPDIDAQSVHALSFNGRPNVMIPAGAEYYSDPVTLAHGAGADLAVSLYFKGEPARQTGHPGSRANSFVTAGQHIAEAKWPQAGKVEHWYLLSDVEVLAPQAVGVLVAIGDSITDGHGATTDGNDRWPDFLVARLRREGMPAMGMVNVGIGGGRMLRDGLGPNMAARFDRDVVNRSGVTHAVVMIGVNDLGGQHRNGDDVPAARQKLIDDLLLAHRQLVERAHAHGICMIGATLTPYFGAEYYHPNLENEADRQQINQWIRTSGVYDAVADFDAALRDPAYPLYMRTAFDSGDKLHPSPAGFRAMAEAVPLSTLRNCKIRP